MKKTKKSKIYKFYMSCYNISKYDNDLCMNDIIGLTRSMSEIKNNKRVKTHNIVATDVVKFGLTQFVNRRSGKVMFYKKMNQQTLNI